MHILLLVSQRSGMAYCALVAKECRGNARNVKSIPGYLAALSATGNLLSFAISRWQCGAFQRYRQRTSLSREPRQGAAARNVDRKPVSAAHQVWLPRDT